jgi:hypothetical protein
MWGFIVKGQVYEIGDHVVMPLPRNDCGFLTLETTLNTYT